jgi:predicted permease
MERLLQDLKFAVRLLTRDRAFSLTMLATLALCIGANAAIFAVVHSVLLRPLPYPDPAQLVFFHNSYPGAGVIQASSGVPDYFDRLRETDVFEEIALYQQRGMTVGSEGSVERVTGMAGTPSLFRMLRAEAVLGRTFTQDEGEIGNERKAVLSHAMWLRAYGGRESAVGSDIRINGQPYRIVGVMPQDFTWMDPAVDIWVPLAFTPEQKSDDARHNNGWTMVGRLKPGATVEQARQQVDALNARNLDRFPALKQILVNAGFHTVVRNLQEFLISEAKPMLLLLWGGVLFVLAIGVVNITNLVLVRSTARMKELATRHALGAGFSRLARQVLTETLLLTLGGASLGVALGTWGLSALSGAGLQALPRGSEIRMDAVTIGYTALLALVVGLVAGLLPIVRMRRLNLSQVFREEGRSATVGRGTRSMRRLLVASEVAFAFVLLAGAGLLLASFDKVINVDPGFDPKNLLTARVSPPASRYQGDAELRAFTDRLLRDVRALPGVAAAGIGSNVPFGGDFSDSVILAEGYQMAPGESLVSPYRVEITPGFLEALQVPLKAGRLFTDSDTASAPAVAIVDEALARKFWPGQNPVGRRMWRPENPNNLTTPSPDQKWITVVGVVGDMKMAGLVTSDTRVGTYYFPVAQEAIRTMTLAVRSAGGDPLELTPSIRKTLTSIDPELPLYSVRLMEDRIDESLVDRRTPMLLALAFAVVALFLAAVGLYGVLAYQVAQRRKEIGIRMALGSEPRGILALVLREGLLVVAAGLVFGLGGALAAGRAMQSQLYGIGGADPLVFGGVTVSLMLVALAACIVPARRAARIDPVIALTE